MLHLVASPEDKRTRALRAAADTCGVPLRLVPWLDALDDPRRVTDSARPGDVLRVDSPGADVATWHALARRGGFTGTVPPGEWRPGRAWFAGLTAALHAFEANAAEIPTTHPADTCLVMTDKLVASEHLAAAGVSVPPTFPAPPDPDALRARLDGLGWGQAFVKARWGSSGAGVVALRRRARGESITTTVHLRDGRLHNDKHLRTYVDPVEIDAVLAPILADGAVLQRWIPKRGARTGDHGGPLDVRVVVLDGRAGQIVARVGRGPITNLHLDARRADVDVLGLCARDRVVDLAVAAAAVFPGHRCLGVDVLVDPSDRVFVGEVNAWGDHLPGLLVDGLDAHGLQLRALASTPLGGRAG